LINDPLRANQTHPLPVTVAFVSDGIKRLRAIGASDAGAYDARDYWRGMRNVAVPADFMAEGGTEAAPMSTSSDFRVALQERLHSHRQLTTSLHTVCSHRLFALQYSNKAEKRLLFKVLTQTFLDRGADLRFLSAFPGESEFLYPPLTYLRPTGRTATVRVGAQELLTCSAREKLLVNPLRGVAAALDPRKRRPAAAERAPLDEAPPGAALVRSSAPLKKEAEVEYTIIEVEPQFAS